MRGGERYFLRSLGLSLACALSVSASVFADSPCTQIQAADNPIPPSAMNIVPISFGTSPFPDAPVNQPLVSVTICIPGTNHCQTIDHLLLDTGSHGLRIFKSLISLNLPQVRDPLAMDSGSTEAECVDYLAGANQWGPVVQADVVLGGEVATQVNFQEIDASNLTQIPANSKCANGVTTSPEDSRYNGVLGVGFLANDCGQNCGSAQSTNYFKCSGNLPCTPTGVSPSYQVENPISKLSSFLNNGISITLPAIGYCGRSGLTGYMTLGVNSLPNNTAPGSVSPVFADPNDLTIITHFEGMQYTGFIDSGTNTYNFSSDMAATLPECAPDSAAPGFFCPQINMDFSAQLQSYWGGAQIPVTFQIANALDLIASGNSAFQSLGSSGDAAHDFDWGIGFFFGKTVYLVRKGEMASGLGTGPLWAF